MPASLLEIPETSVEAAIAALGAAAVAAPPTTA